MNDGATALRAIDLSELIKARRSAKVFIDQPVELHLIIELLETAVYAPNHRLTEPWRFVIVESFAAREELAEIGGALAAERGKDARAAADKLRAVPLFLFVIMREHHDELMRTEDYAATCCVVQNFLLLATERGLGTLWKTIADNSRLRRLLELADDERVVAFLHLGYAAAALPPSKARRTARERTRTL